MSKSTHQLFGPWLRRERKQQRMTLPALAAKAGISKGAVSKIERGGDAKLSNVTKLCHVLNCTIKIEPPIRWPLPL